MKNIKWRNKVKGINVLDIYTAASYLIGLSNNFFTPYRCPVEIENDNRTTAEEICKLLHIREH